MSGYHRLGERPRIPFLPAIPNKGGDYNDTRTSLEPCDGFDVSDSLTYLKDDGTPGHHDDEHNPYAWDPRYQTSSPSPAPHPAMDPRYHGASPSPHLQSPQGYQLHDRPYTDHPQQPLDIPVGPGPTGHSPFDRLQAQPTVGRILVHD